MLDQAIAQAERIGNVVGLWLVIGFGVALFFGFRRMRGGHARFGDFEIDLPGGDSRQSEREGEKPSLIHHRLFHILRNARSPGFILDGPMTVKRAINTAFLRDCKIKIFHEGLFEFFTELEKNSGAGLSKLPDKINRLIEDYERAALRIQIELPDGNTICGVPSCYQKKFNNWHKPHTKLCLSGITEALDSRFYPDWWTRATICLEYIAMSFDLTFEDAEKTLEQLNGDLDREIAEMLCEDR